MNEELNEVMLDLLCKKAVYGLTEQEELELARLQDEAGVDDQSLSFELAAAAIGAGSVGYDEEMPAHLRSQILAGAERYFDERAPVSTVQALPERSSIFNWLGWAVAAAACLALALNIYYTRSRPPIAQGGTPTPTPEIKLTPDQMRQRLIESAPDLARGNWSPGKMANVKPAGDVVWSDDRQEGYIRISGLPRNDPAKETYQLWIIAENQDPKTPVDGGTFDISTEGEVVIPIDAKVKAQNPQAFAITVEKPGGVPVSKQEQVPAIAKRET